MRHIYFITTNDYKFERFTKTAGLAGAQVLQLREATPEIQGANNQEIAEFSTKWAADTFKHPVLKEDVGLYIDAYEGFPGPYLAHVEKQPKTDGFLKLLAGVKDRSAHWEYAIAYCEPGKEPVSFSTQYKGSIATAARGKGGWYADKLFVPEGQQKTIAELLDAETYERDEHHYALLRDYFAHISQP
jgi:XTP/dITP diphosphohydrolase